MSFHTSKPSAAVLPEPRKLLAWCARAFTAQHKSHDRYCLYLFCEQKRVVFASLDFRRDAFRQTTDLLVDQVFLQRLLFFVRQPHFHLHTTKHHMCLVLFPRAPVTVHWWRHRQHDFTGAPRLALLCRGSAYDVPQTVDWGGVPFFPS